jgi:hypothetical protein
MKMDELTRKFRLIHNEQFCLQVVDYEADCGYKAENVLKNKRVRISCWKF